MAFAGAWVNAASVLQMQGVAMTGTAAGVGRNQFNTRCKGFSGDGMAVPQPSPYVIWESTCCMRGQKMRLSRSEAPARGTMLRAIRSRRGVAGQQGARWHTGFCCQAGPEGGGGADDEKHGGKSETKGTSDSIPPPPPETNGLADSEGDGYPIPPDVAARARRGATLPKQVTDALRDQVFGFDTFFVTGQQPYEGGALFQGNLRGEPAKAFEKIDRRLQEKFPDKYRLYLLTSPETEKPVAVIVPKESTEVEPTPIPEWLTALAFGVTALGAIVFRNGFPLDPSSLPDGEELGSALVAGLPGTLAMVAILLAHEAGHWVVAKRVGAKLSFPFLVPSWQLGTFGAITRITNVLPSRQALLEVSAAGPLAGSAAAIAFLIIGLLIPMSDGAGIPVEASAFHESFVIGGLTKLVLGDRLVEGATINLNPVVLAAWSQLLVNALNSIPFGELDGGRIALSLFGRKAAGRWTNASLALLGLAAIFNDVAFYWVALIVFLQRRPITPQANELTPPDNTGLALGVGVLFLCLAVVFPYPFNFS